MGNCKCRTPREPGSENTADDLSVISDSVTDRIDVILRGIADPIEPALGGSEDDGDILDDTFSAENNHSDFLNTPDISFERESLISQLEKIYIEEDVCGICAFKYDDNEHVPKILPCGHTLCYYCIRNIAKKQFYCYVECPLDRQQHQIKTRERRVDDIILPLDDSSIHSRFFESDNDEFISLPNLPRPTFVQSEPSEHSFSFSVDVSVPGDDMDDTNTERWSERHDDENIVEYNSGPLVTNSGLYPGNMRLLDRINTTTDQSTQTLSQTNATDSVGIQSSTMHAEYSTIGRRTNEAIRGIEPLRTSHVGHENLSESKNEILTHSPSVDTRHDTMAVKNPESKQMYKTVIDVTPTKLEYNDSDSELSFKFSRPRRKRCLDQDDLYADERSVRSYEWVEPDYPL